MDHAEYLKRVKSYIKTPTKEIEEQLEEFCKMCSYISGQYDKDESFQELEKHMTELEGGRNETNRVFYMALPPSVFIPVSEHLKKNCYPKNGITRIIVSPSCKMFLLLGIGSHQNRLRSRSAKTWEALVSSRPPSSQTGRKRRSSVLTTTSARRW